LPSLLLIGLYAGYILSMSIFKPASMPVLPPEARNLREPDGSSGVPSLLVLLVVSVAAAIGFAALYGESNATGVMATAVGVGVALAAATVNRVFKIGLLSRIAERIVFVLVPPLALIFLVLGTIFMGIA